MLKKSGGYDRSLTMFSPEGRLFQVEYALEAVRKGSLVVGLKCDEGTAIIVQKKLPTILMDPDSVQKVFQIDEHIGCSISGLHADSRILVDYARVQCQVNKLSYDEPIRLRSLVRKLADIKQQYTQRGGLRPFGSALLFIAVDSDGPQLMTTSPSGTYWSWKATALGNNSEQAKKILKENYDEKNSLDQIMKLGIKVQKECSDEEMDPSVLQIVFISSEDAQFQIADEKKIKELINTA
ncbi:MAG: archaeal proteasome endopeptidase complex subunit alpha [Promethearchaeota archaeon]